jgi:hypothetical protein
MKSSEQSESIQAYNINATPSIIWKNGEAISAYTAEFSTYR